MTVPGNVIMVAVVGLGASTGWQVNPVKQHPMPEFMPTPLARFLKSRPEVMQWIAIYFRS